MNNTTPPDQPSTLQNSSLNANRNREYANGLLLQAPAAHHMGGGLAQSRDCEGSNMQIKGSCSVRGRQGGSISERLPGFEPSDENSADDDCGSNGVASPERRNFAAKYGELTQKYSSKNFRDNPLVSNKGRSRGAINFIMQDRAATIDLITSTTKKKRENDKHMSVQSNNGLIVSNNNHQGS